MFGSLIKAFQRWRAVNENPPARRLYAAAVTQARQPAFYRDLMVPDTIDGRFDMVVLHVFLLLYRLKDQGQDADQVGRKLLETMIEDFDLSIRELGVGDSGVSRRVQKMVRGFAGRLAAYHNAFAAVDDLALDVALDNNVYGTVRAVPAATRAALVAYVRQAIADLAAQPLEGLLEGQVVYAGPPAAPLSSPPPAKQED